MFSVFLKDLHKLARLQSLLRLRVSLQKKLITKVFLDIYIYICFDHHLFSINRFINHPISSLTYFITFHSLHFITLRAFLMSIRSPPLVIFRSLDVTMHKVGCLLFLRSGEVVQTPCFYLNPELEPRIRILDLELRSLSVPTSHLYTDKERK